MESNRTNLDDLGRNSSYLVLSIAFIILSVAGLILFFQIRKPKPETPPTTPTPTPEISAEIPTLPAKASPTIAPPSTPTLPADLSAEQEEALAEAGPTPLILNFQSDVDKFSVVYHSDRKLYQDTEVSGNRYTFYRSDSTITVHVGPSWSWSHPGRTFSSEFLVGGQSTFRYDIAAQTIVDIQKDNLLYTIQCIHRGFDSAKSECQDFLSNFKLL